MSCFKYLLQDNNITDYTTDKRFIFKWVCICKAVLIYATDICQFNRQFPLSPYFCDPEFKYWPQKVLEFNIFALTGGIILLMI